MLNSLRKNLAKFISPALNAMSLPNQFLRFGNRDRVVGNWDEVMIADQDLYTGYAYAAIRNRATYVSHIASEQVKTKDEDEGQELRHPYLDLIENSKSFSEFAFWYQISTYLDLEGVYYLYVNRAYNESRTSGTGKYGNPQKFVLLNPYQITRVLKQDTLEVGGYIENRKGFQREIAPENIIEIRELNPFDQDTPFSMTDAAKESQFTLKTSSNYTRQTIRNNINAPGILSTDVILDEPRFENFKARVVNHTKGEPIFGNGAGAVDWQSMSIDLSKAALKDTNEINRDALLSTSGVSKTIMSIEQSGVTRDTARVQKDLFIEGQILPRIQLILDALNLDYRNRYEKLYTEQPMYLCVENPQEVDQAAEKTRTEVQKLNLELYMDLLSKGYAPKKAAAFLNGDIGVEGLGKPKELPKSEDAETDTDKPDDTQPPAAEQSKKKDNKLENEQQSEVDQQKSQLKNAIVNIEQQIVIAAINKVEKNSYEEQTDVVSQRKKNSFIDELALVLSAFYTVVFQIKGHQTMDERIASLGYMAIFRLDRTATSYIKDMSSKVAESHVNTVINDILETARKAALEGLSQSEIVSKIKTEFTTDISTTRAETIARTETNRAFTQAQYNADRQFISQNKLQKRAYKRWKTRSGNPCGFCEALAGEGLIPFDLNFRDLGEEVVVAGEDGKTKTLNITFESLEAGNAHPNCSCIYELVIQ